MKKSYNDAKSRSVGMSGDTVVLPGKTAATHNGGLQARRQPNVQTEEKRHFKTTCREEYYFDRTDFL